MEKTTPMSVFRRFLKKKNTTIFLVLVGMCLLLGIAMGYRGRVLATALPRYYIYDPDSYHASDDSDYDSSDYSSSDYDSSSSDSDGGGLFGGGGASGSW